MTNLTLAAQQIKDCISAIDTGKAMGLEIRHGRCKCPMHGGHDYNCVLYKGDRGFYCHVCKAGGDVIKLAQSYYGMSFKDTISWFNDTFSMGMDIESPISPDTLRRAKKRQETRAREREAQEWQDRMRFEMYLTAGDILRMLERQRDENVPKTPWEKWNWKFRVAVEQIPIWRRIVDDAAMDCMKARK